MKPSQLIFKNFFKFLGSCFLMSFLSVSSFSIETPTSLQKHFINSKLQSMAQDTAQLRMELQILAQKDPNSSETKSLQEKYQKLNQSYGNELKKIITQWGWPGLSIFGEKADQDAFDIVFFQDDFLSLQKQALVILEKQWKDQKNTHATHVPKLLDRISRNENKPQLFGTELQYAKNGCVIPYRLNSSKRKVNQRRKLFGLESLNQFLCRANKSLGTPKTCCPSK